MDPSTPSRPPPFPSRVFLFFLLLPLALLSPVPPPPPPPPPSLPLYLVSFASALFLLPSGGLSGVAHRNKSKHPPRGRHGATESRWMDPRSCFSIPRNYHGATMGVQPAGSASSAVYVLAANDPRAASAPLFLWIPTTCPLSFAFCCFNYRRCGRLEE